ncbi:MAG TPA: acetyl-CoA carboxylase biotin carboxyl carrier protein subunit [Candidatus Sulfotelmatobacter sp.]|jgi:biotin carboxyl carrier protein|nr:acetyl-CoA carboxylase biotin carboxyl carrier protein subunit [Candidatus Sulfotelmatobacter sp.]
MKFEIQLTGTGGKRKHVVELERKGNVCSVALGGQAVDADAVQIAPNAISVMLAGQSFEIHVSRSPDGTLNLRCGPHEFSAEIIDPRAWRGRKHGAVEVEGRQEILAPMPGKVVRLLAALGDTVEAGQGLLVVEAMKMQNEIRSPKSGKVERLLVKEGQNVNAGEVLAWVE